VPKGKHKTHKDGNAVIALENHLFLMALLIRQP
jgi:hypothetical protein